ncbi:hypothetical protein SNEBB_001660 [Seison nebaliae]|nr:hypothetical protein SNEBB_001660 [Seison nebaliae]
MNSSGNTAVMEQTAVTTNGTSEVVKANGCPVQESETVAEKKIVSEETNGSDDKCEKEEEVEEVQVKEGEGDGDDVEKEVENEDEEEEEESDDGEGGEDIDTKCLVVGDLMEDDHCDKSFVLVDGEEDEEDEEDEMTTETDDKSENAHDVSNLSAEIDDLHEDAGDSLKSINGRKRRKPMDNGTNGNDVSSTNGTAQLMITENGNGDVLDAKKAKV